MAVGHRPHTLVLALIVCALLAVAGPLRAVEPVDAAAPDTVDLEPHVELLEDTDGSLDLGEVAHGAASRRFEPLDTPLAYKGYTDSAWWVRVTLQNRTNAPVRRVLSVDWPRLEDVRLHQPTASGWQTLRSGWFAEREGSERTPSHSFPLELRPREMRTIYLRVSSRTELSFPMRLLTQRAHTRDLTAGSLLIGMYTGALLALALYNLVLFARLRERYHFYYFAAATAWAAETSIDGGWLSLALPTGSYGPVLSTTLTSVWAISQLAFGRSLLDTARTLPRVDRVMRALSYAVAGCAFLSFVSLPFGGMLGTLAILASVLTLLTAGALAARGGNRVAGWFVSAYAIFVVGVLISLLAFAGVIQVESAVFGVPILFGSLAELIVLAVAASERVRTAIEQRQEVLRLGQRERVLAMQGLVAGVTHELNSPVGSLKSASDTVDKAVAHIEGGLDEATRSQLNERAPRTLRALEALPKLAETIRGSTERLSNIVDSLRNFTQLDRADEQSTDVGEGIDSAIELMRRKLGDRITIERDYRHESRVRARPAELNQVFMALIDNAVDAIDGSGTIRITTRERHPGGKRNGGRAADASGTGASATNDRGTADGKRFVSESDTRNDRAPSNESGTDTSNDRAHNNESGADDRSPHDDRGAAGNARRTRGNHASLGDDGGELVVRIADDGCGMSAEQLARVLEPGFAKTGRRVHLGLGLPTSLAIVQDHGGKLELDSKLGEGTTVAITLPLGAE